MADSTPSATSEYVRNTAGSGQPGPNICAECRKLDFEFLQSHPGSRRVIRVHKVAKCECCRFLWSSLEIRGAIPDAELAQETVNDIEIRCAEEEDGPFRVGRLVVSIAGIWNIARISVLLPLEPSVNAQWATSDFRPIDPKSIDYDLLRSWIHNCQENHFDSCAHTHIRSDDPSDDVPGFKVIDCLERKVKKKTASAISYVTLSYVWGQSLCEADREQGQYEVKEGILSLDLPATIADAISVTLQLGFRYLWVDKYCIDQHNAGEVYSQISQMDKIYHAASLTIIAAAGDNAHYGLPGVGNRPRKSQNTVTMNNVDWVSVTADLKSLVKSSQWHTRGWTYQEGFFSRTRLMFTEEQVIFECNSDSFCEQERGTERRSGIGLAPSFSYHAAEFILHLQGYASRDLTHQTDILNGMKGVFRFFATSAEPQNQYWGLPVSGCDDDIMAVWLTLSHISLCSYRSIPHGLTMRSEESLTIAFSIALSWSKWSRANNRPVGDGTRRHGFPSWSWCGWKISPVWRYRYAGEYQNDIASVPQDIRVEQVVGSTLPLSEELAARLSLDQTLATGSTYRLHMRVEILNIEIEYLEQAIVFPHDRNTDRTRYAARKISDSRIEDGESELGGEQLLLWPMETTPFMDEHHEMHATLCNQVVQCIILARPWGLVVYTTDTGVCERIGLIHVLAKSSADATSQEHCGPHLREHFPGSVRDIVLA